MNAAVLTEFGEEDKLHFVKSRARPQCTEHQVLVRVRACAIGELDIEVRSGQWSKFTKTPCGTGYEISGVVHEKGSQVRNVNVGDEVVAILPLDSPHGGCVEFTVLDAVNVIRKPDLVTHEEAAASLLSGLEAYTAFHYLLHMRANEFLLILSGQHDSDTIAIQLAGMIGAKVIVTAHSTAQLNTFGDCGNHVVRVIDLAAEDLVDGVMKETGGMGVNCVLDLQRSHAPYTPPAKHESKLADAGSAEEKDETPINADSVSLKPTMKPKSNRDNNLACKTDIVQCLAVHGRWATKARGMQLDPPESEQLLFRNASLSYLFPQAWLLSPTQHGRYLHIMQDLLDKLSKGTLKAMVKSQTYSLDKIRKAHRDVTSETVGRVVIRM